MFQYSLALATQPTNEFDTVLSKIEANGSKWAKATSKAESKKMGQFFTPLAMAAQLSALLPRDQVNDGTHKIIADPGAGTGILSTTFAARVQKLKPTPMSVFGFETDPRLFNDFSKAWEHFQEQSTANIEVNLSGDFTKYAKELLTTNKFGDLPRPSVVITNPPFIKLKKDSELSQIMTEHGIPVTNLYAVFAALATSWLEDDGHLLLVCPRSFANGDYFKRFRSWISARMSVEHIVLYKSRSCFENVLQENVCVYLKKSPQSARVRITVAESPTSKPEYDIILPSKETITNDGWWMPRSVNDIELINKNRKHKYNLTSLGLSFSTGKMELHRLSTANNPISTPVIYARDFDKHSNWTWGEVVKPRNVSVQTKQIIELPESGGYVVIKRISSNDGANPQRILPAFLSRSTVGHTSVTIDNHVQYIHRDGQPLSETECMELVRFLSSDEANAVIRAISGSTQVNKSDMAKLNLPENMSI